MTAAILEIRDGVATGPLHQPVPVLGRNTTFDDEAFNWPTLCGVKGHAYQRNALAALGHTTDCFECAVEALKRPFAERGTKPCEECGRGFVPSRSDERFCGKQCWRQNYRRRNLARLRDYQRAYMREQRGTPIPEPRPCSECGKVFTPRPLGNREGVRFCCSRCRNRHGQRRRRAA